MDMGISSEHIPEDEPVMSTVNAPAANHGERQTGQVPGIHDP